MSCRAWTTRSSHSEWRSGVAVLVGPLGHCGHQPGTGALQPVGTDSGEALAPLPECQRLLQGQPAGLKPLDQLCQLVASLLVGGPCGLGLRRACGAVTGSPNLTLMLPQVYRCLIRRGPRRGPR